MWRKVILGVVVGTVAIGILAPAAYADTRTASSETQRLVFETTLADFMSARAANWMGTELDWSTDRCSYSLDAPFGYRFYLACIRHDFGYRNYKKYGMFTSEARYAIDGQFRKDLDVICALESSGAVSQQACGGLAAAYWAVVRLAGGFA